MKPSHTRVWNVYDITNEDSGSLYATREVAIAFATRTATEYGDLKVEKVDDLGDSYYVTTSKCTMAVHPVYVWEY